MTEEGVEMASGERFNTPLPAPRVGGFVQAAERRL